MNLLLHLQLPKLHHTLHFKEIYVVTKSHYKLQYLFSCTVFWPQYITLRNYWVFCQMFRKYKRSEQILCWPKKVVEYFLASAHWIMCLITNGNRGHTVALTYFSYIQSPCPEILKPTVPMSMCISIFSPEDGNRWSFHNVVFTLSTTAYQYLFFWQVYVKFTYQCVWHSLKHKSCPVTPTTHYKLKKLAHKMCLLRDFSISSCYNCERMKQVIQCFLQGLFDREWLTAVAVWLVGVLTARCCGSKQGGSVTCLGHTRRQPQELAWWTETFQILHNNIVTYCPHV